MASIKLEPGTLNPGACYENEQQRLEAYVAKIVATIIGGLQWETQQSQPVDLGIYWLRQNTDGRSRGPRRYNTTDGRWVPWLEIPIMPDSSGGAANVYTATTGHSLVSGAVRITGRRIVFEAVADNTGASTLDVDGTGAVAIVRHGADALLPGDLTANSLYEVIFNAAGGGRWELATPVPPTELELPLYASTAEFAVPAAGSAVEVSHSGGKVPFACRVVAVCKTAIDGYSVGEEFDAQAVSADFNAAEPDGPAYTIAVTTSKINVACCDAGGGMTYAKRTGGNANWLTSSPNWMFKAYLTFLP